MGKILIGQFRLALGKERAVGAMHRPRVCPEKGCPVCVSGEPGLGLTSHTELHMNLKSSQLSGTCFPSAKGKAYSTSYIHKIKVYSIFIKLFGGINKKKEFKTKVLIVCKALELKPWA